MAADPVTVLEHYKQRIVDTLRELGIPESLATNRRQSLQLEGEDLVSIGLDMSGREQRLERVAAAQWHAMRAAAESEGVALAIISAFRSFDYQKQIMGKTAASLNRIVKGVGAGLGGFLVTAGFTALLALPAAGFVAIVGCMPLMHWLWPIAAGIATMPLILGGIVGGIKGLMGILRK